MRIIHIFNSVTTMSTNPDAASANIAATINTDAASANTTATSNTHAVTATSNPSNLGRSDSTIARMTTAIKHFNQFQAQRFEPSFDELKEIHVINENLKLVIGSFATYISKTAIPSMRSLAGNNIGSETKKHYVTSIKEAMKNKFPGHCEWMPGSGFEEWFKDLQQKASKEATRTAQTDEFKDHTCRGIYKNVNTGIYMQGAIADRLEEGAEGVDLHGIAKLLMNDARREHGWAKNKTPFLMRAQLVATYHSVGRPGECEQ